MKSELTEDPKLSFETTQGRAYNTSDLNSAKKMPAKWILDKKKKGDQRKRFAGEYCFP